MPRVSKVTRVSRVGPFVDFRLKHYWLLALSFWQIRILSTSRLFFDLSANFSHFRHSNGEALNEVKL